MYVPIFVTKIYDSLKLWFLYSARYGSYRCHEQNY